MPDGWVKIARSHADEVWYKDYLINGLGLARGYISRYANTWYARVTIKPIYKNQLGSHKSAEDAIRAIEHDLGEANDGG